MGNYFPTLNTHATVSGKHVRSLAESVSVFHMCLNCYKVLLTRNIWIVPAVSSQVKAERRESSARTGSRALYETRLVRCGWRHGRWGGWGLGGRGRSPWARCLLTKRKQMFQKKIISNSVQQICY